MRKILVMIMIWLSLMITAIILESCCDTKNYEFTWNSMSIDYLQRSTNEYNRGSGTQTNSDNFLYDRFGLRLAFKADLIAQNQYSFSLISPAKAAIDCFNKYNPKYKVKSIQIETLNDFNSAKTKHSDIADYFEASLYNGVLVNINDYLNNEYEINGKSTNDKAVEQFIDLYLKEKPDLDSLFNFVIKVHLDNGTMFSDTTKELKIK